MLPWDHRVWTVRSPEAGTSIRVTNRNTISRMSTLTIRTDPEVEKALESLTRDGRSRSEAVRAAILAADREERRARMRAEAEAIRNDPDEAAASRQLTEEMETIRAW
jgi:Arc/MetJ-type ribon-helix-helix transcriptional regulator